MFPIQKALLVFMMTAAVPAVSHAALTETQKQTVVEAIEKGELAVLDYLSVDEDLELKPTLASTLKVDRPGTYEFGGVDNVDISRNAVKRGVTITVPTCPK